MTHHLCWPLSAEPISISLLSLFGSAGSKGQDVFIAQQQTTLEVCAPRASLHSQPPTTTGDIRVFQKYTGNKKTTSKQPCNALTRSHNSELAHRHSLIFVSVPTQDVRKLLTLLVSVSLSFHLWLCTASSCQSPAREGWKLKWQLWSCQLLANHQERACAFWDNTSPNTCTEPLSFNMCVNSWRFPYITNCHLTDC